MQIEIQQKPDKEFKEDRKIKSTQDIYNLEEIQAIKGAIQEHIVFIGLNNSNIITKINILGIGKENCAYLDIKEIVRNALLSASNKIILVHNHPSSSLEPSKFDIQLTNTTSKLLKAFNLQLLDHIIVNENNYISMGKDIDKNFENEQINLMNIAILEQENYQLKVEIDYLENRLQEYESIIEEEFE